MPRWERTLGIDLIQGLVFLPHLPHAEMLTVVANCRVMLDTFPWGAGVTGMEALFAGVPVVTLPARISILPLALGQVSSDCFWPSLCRLVIVGEQSVVRIPSPACFGTLDHIEQSSSVSTRSRSKRATCNIRRTSNQT